ncbi:hypothetical protein [Glacieibacterium sp.]|uniref:hypothetical protein n=1 Tax=Glacieibacterium sp. TaxID=2860237 RepID=UPI003B00196C
MGIIDFSQFATVNPRNRSTDMTYSPLFQGKLGAVMEYVYSISPQALTGLEIDCTEFGQHPISVAKAIALTRAS